MIRAVRGCSAHLHDVEEDLLPQAVLAFEELVLGVGAGDVSADELLARGRHLQQLGVLVLHRHVGGVAQQLPDDGTEMVRDALPDQLLEGKEGERPCSLCGEGCNFKHFLRRKEGADSLMG